jgi:hypothetical protein
VRRVAGGVVVLLAVMLPALLAFAAIDAPVTELEVRRVEQGLFADRGELGDLPRMFYGATLPANARDNWTTQRDAQVIAGRLAGMLALLAISGLVYLLLAQVRGRATAVIACLGLACLGPVLDAGYVLRPEQAATMFGLLGVVLLAGLPVMLRRRRRTVAGFLSLGSLMVLVGALFGLAMAMHHAAWIYLAIPAGTLGLSVLALGFLLPRATRGRPFTHWPFRAAARRYGPWMAVVLISSAMVAMMLSQAGGQPDRSTPLGNATGLLPAGLWLRGPVLLLGAVGAARMGYGVSLRLQRLRTVRPDTVVFVYVAALLVQWLSLAGERDQLPAAAALACLVGDGAMTVAVLVTARLRPPSPAAAAS